MHILITRMLLLDIFIVISATIISAILRENFNIYDVRYADLLPYLVATAAASAVFMPLFGTNRMMWQFSCLSDYLKLLSAMTAITIGSVAIAFAMNRLEGVPRSLPFLQFNLSLTMLIGLRVFYRKHRAARGISRKKMAPLRVVEQAETETVLLVGLSRLTDAYLQTAVELAAERIRIAGIVGHSQRHIGRLVAGYKVFGVPEAISAILSELEVKGVTVDRIVITAPFAFFSAEARAAIAAVERSRSLPVQYLPENLGFGASPERQSTQNASLMAPKAKKSAMAFEIEPSELLALQARVYWKVKRTIDIAAAISLLVLTLPLLLIVTACTAISTGRPLLFWQQRPGLGGRPFRLYKFRTMRSAHDGEGRKLSDAERVTTVGAFLRATRLDELPQLLNILLGDMSFIGPRPLLPCDQDTAHRARLLVRPGLTGWAQIIGGRAISPEDKAALDIWYVRNASLFLDFKIALKTVPIVLFGETISRKSIEKAWEELEAAGVLRGLEARKTAYDHLGPECLKAS
jgi:lipopolysaccharide/colanic/teichoic acid biosynthesis glycosyltransferase